MVTWPEPSGRGWVINHLLDAEVFLRLLERVYSPVLVRSARLAPILTDRSRLEMAVTNDVLQVQLIPSEPYSMIRHHALMLFEATLWLPPRERFRWGELYSAIADMAMSERIEAPTVGELADIESNGLEAMRLTAGATNDPSAVDALLEDRAVEPIARYQLWATAAIGALWRDFASREAPTEMQWQDDQLARYPDESYLAETLRRWL
ncbi:hypothetical protein ACFQ9V_20485 [Leifsonia sp. NPDC056665]|uniref:hypothetical protein n=1 Tax=Leifsonia sp. NPDC056665 TaxID=3345901 RepID=UPI0036741210